MGINPCFMSDNKNLLSLIRERSAFFSGQQKKVADYLLVNHKKAAFLTTTELSIATGASSATINRFCVSLGFKGFSDFQRALQGVIQNELTAIDRAEVEPSSGSSLSRIFQSEIISLQNALKLIPRGIYERALSLLINAGTLVVVGHQASEALARYGSYTLGKVRPSVRRLDVGELDASGILSGLGPGDAALVFCMPRYPVKTILALRALKDIGVPVVMVTHSELSVYAPLGDVVLAVPVKYHSFADGLSPLFCLLNSFASDIYRHDADKGKKNLESFERLAKDLFVQEK